MPGEPRPAIDDGAPQDVPAGNPSGAPPAQPSPVKARDGGKSPEPPAPAGSCDTAASVSGTITLPDASTLTLVDGFAFNDTFRGGDLNVWLTTWLHPHGVFKSPGNSAPLGSLAHVHIHGIAGQKASVDVFYELPQAGGGLPFFSVPTTLTASGRKLGNVVSGTLSLDGPKLKPPGAISAEVTFSVPHCGDQSSF